jgi:metal-responsive CopG/Arc/MetJ family transcriptional regulator
MAVARTNLTLPKELLREVDAIAGPRGRSAYVAEAVAQRVKRDRLRRAFSDSRGAMVGKPGRRGREEVLRWVRELRSEERDSWPPSS